MSKSESEKLVAVMLSESDAEWWARQDKVKDPLARVTIRACKRALRPEPPSRSQADVVRLLGVGPRPMLADWIEYVLEHGWEVE